MKTQKTNDLLQNSFSVLERAVNLARYQNLAETHVHHLRQLLTQNQPNTDRPKFSSQLSALVSLFVTKVCDPSTKPITFTQSDAPTEPSASPPHNATVQIGKHFLQVHLPTLVQIEQICVGAEKKLAQLENLFCVLKAHDLWEHLALQQKFAIFSL